MGRALPLVLCVALLAACAAPAEPALQPPQVTLIADGQTRTLRSSALTVRDLLAEAGITLDADDRVEPAEPTLLEDGLTVRVVRVEERTESERREVPFERRTVHDASVPAGETRLLEPGITGIEELTYRITLEAASRSPAAWRAGARSSSPATRCSSSAPRSN